MRGVKLSTLSALSTGIPLTMSATSRILRGGILTYLNLAVACTGIAKPYPFNAEARSTSLPPCPRKVRVGANSPSLCPTMFSVM